MTPKRLLTFALGAAAAAALAPGSQAQEEQELRIYNWSDYIDSRILEDFTKETGIKVVYDVYDSNDLLETKLLAGQTGYDIVVPGAVFLARQIEAGVFQKLDKSKLPNLGHMWPAIMERVAEFDPGNEYSVPYMWGTTAFAYNEAKIKERMPDAPVDSWRMVLDPEVVKNFADCGVMVVDASDEVIANVLNYAGEDPASHDPEVIAKAESVLMPIRPYVQKFHASEYINALAAGDICLAVGFSGDMLQARERAKEAGQGVDIRYSVPKEGAYMWFDQMAIPADAPHPDNAHRFLDFLQRPEQIARATNAVFYANGNLASQKLVAPEILNDPAVYPTPEVMEQLFSAKPYPPRVQRVVTRLWTKVKTAGG